MGYDAILWSSNHHNFNDIMAKGLLSNTFITSHHKSIMWYEMMPSWLNSVITLCKVAFDWFQDLLVSSIKWWRKVETWLLLWFYYDETEVIITTLMVERKEDKESVVTSLKGSKNLTGVQKTCLFVCWFKHVNIIS